MPKKKSEKKKNKKEQEISEEEQEESEEPEEESSLEEKIDDIEKIIDTKQFQNFMQHDFQAIPQEIGIEEVGTPVLERINAPQEDITALEWGLMQSTDFGKREKSDENDPSKYNVGRGAQKDELKYHHYEESAEVPKVDISSLGRNPFSERPQIGFRSSEEKFESVNKEQYNPVKIQDTRELGKEKDSFDKKEVKYTPSKY